MEEQTKQSITFTFGVDQILKGRAVSAVNGRSLNKHLNHLLECDVKASSETYNGYQIVVGFGTGKAFVVSFKRHFYNKITKRYKYFDSVDLAKEKIDKLIKK